MMGNTVLESLDKTTRKGETQAILLGAALK